MRNASKTLVNFLDLVKNGVSKEDALKLCHHTLSTEKKVLHKRPKDDEIDKIHPDLRLSVKELSVEFQDDPFEVRD